jgi:NitT/TauT family transport system ATP-binding protein
LSSSGSFSIYSPTIEAVSSLGAAKSGAPYSADAIQLRGVTKRFAATLAGMALPVLAAVDLEIPAGQFVAVLGPSGCGKSTLLRLLSGLEKPSSGELTLAGHPPGQGGNLAYVFQDATLLPWLRVGANVETLLRLRGVSATERAMRRAAALALVGLADREDAFPRQLSGGQRMRVSLARALATEPRVLLLDEPFGALDELTRDRLGEELLAIRARQGWTALFVTHSVAEAVFLADRIIILAARPGRVAHDLRVELPGPRGADTRALVAYHAQVAEVSRRLREVSAMP